MKGIILLLSILFTFSPLATAKDKQPLPNKAKAFVRYMEKTYHYDRAKLIRLLKQAKYDARVMEKITHPYEKQPWYVYRRHFITKNRIMNGVHYWKKHLKELRYAQKKFGIPPHIIVAVIGIETNYGKQKGTYSALNALTTLAFNHKSRGSFFKRELAHLILLTEEQELPILNVKSSYAGALGIPQFMPSTYRNYAVKYPSNKHIDLLSNDPDAIVSVANYFKIHGWHKNKPIAIPIQTKKRLKKRLISDRARPKLAIEKLEKKGIYPIEPVRKQLKAAVIALKDRSKDEYWLTFHNFRVIMSYNPSILYAMSVYQLSRTIQKAYEQQTS